LPSAKNFFNSIGNSELFELVEMVRVCRAVQDHEKHHKLASVDPKSFYIPQNLLGFFFDMIDGQILNAG